MAAGLTAKLEVVGYGVTLLCGSFAPNGASAIDSASNKGRGYTVARSAQGLFTVTLANLGWSSLLCGTLTPQMAAATSVNLQFRAVDVTTAGTVQIANAPAGSDTDIAANANNRVHFALFLATSSLNP